MNASGFRDSPSHQLNFTRVAAICLANSQDLRAEGLRPHFFSSRSPTPPHANASEEISAKSADNSSEAKGGMPLAQAKAQGNFRSFRSRPGQRATNEAGNCGSALPGPSTPSAPLALGLCLSRASSLVLEENHRSQGIFLTYEVFTSKFFVYG